MKGDLSMKTKYKAIIAICCVLLAGCVTAAAILLMPDRTTADDGEEFDPADVDKFTVEDKYKDVLEGIKAEMTEYLSLIHISEPTRH